MARIDRRFVPTVEVVADGIRAELTARQRDGADRRRAVGMLALLVALAGIGATAAQSVTERTREIGIRMALGAGRRSAVAFIVRRVLRPVVVGLIAGLGIAVAAVRVLGSILYGVSPFDPLAFTAAIASWRRRRSAPRGCRRDARRRSIQSLPCRSE